MSLKDKVAIVTGASRGIGKAIALRLAQEGCNIASVSRSVESASGPAEAIRQFGVKCEPYGVDISDGKAVSEATDSIVRSFGQVDILVNNAGIVRDGLLMRMSSEDWNQVLQTNLSGAFYWTKAVSKTMMRARYGRIINLSSVIGLHGNAGQVNYASAKAGLLGLTKSVAKEFASRNITCNAICPGFIQTDMTGSLAGDMKEKLLAQIPLGRLGEPEDIAHLAFFLASDGAGYITGQIFSVDGGLFI